MVLLRLGLFFMLFLCGFPPVSSHGVELPAGTDKPARPSNSGSCSDRFQRLLRLFLKEQKRRLQADDCVWLWGQEALTLQKETANVQRSQKRAEGRAHAHASTSRLSSQVVPSQPGRGSSCRPVTPSASQTRSCAARQPGVFVPV